MSKLKTAPFSKGTPIDKQKMPPDNSYKTKQRQKPVVSALQLEATFLSKQLSIEIEEKNQMINSLRQENLSLQSDLQKLRARKRQRNRFASVNISANHMLIQDDSLDEIDQINVIMEICQRLEGILDQNLSKDLTSIANIYKDFSKILTNDPNCSKTVEHSLSSLEESIKKITDNQQAGSFSKTVANFKDIMKQEREFLKKQLQEAINANVKLVQEKQQTILAKEMEILSSLPQSLRQLKEASKKREEEYKKQILFLQEKIIAMSEESRHTIQSQNTLIEQLRQSLIKLKETYTKQVQIPLINIRQSVQKEIKIIKAEFADIHRNRSMNIVIGNLIDALNRYTESKNLANNQEMRDEIRNINQKLTMVNDQSMKTINEVRNIIRSSQHLTTDHDFLAKSRSKESQISLKKKEKDELSIEVKYEKQKEYIDMLERYNQKLEQSVMRTQKQGGKYLYEEWKAIQGQYRAREKETNKKLDLIEQQVTHAKSQIIQIKKAALSILQTEKSLTRLFESFEGQIVSIQSFKDQLFNFLENQLKFRQQINRQVELFNRMFVDQYNKFSKLQTMIPEPDLQMEAKVDQQKFTDALLESIYSYNKFRQDYEGLFKSKTNADIKFHKYFTSIAQLHDDYSKIAKNKADKLSIQLNFQPIKTHINSAILKVEDLQTNTRVLRDFIVKNFNMLKQDLEKNNEQLQKIVRFVKQAKLQDTIGLAYQLFERKNRLMLDVEQLLSQFTGSKIQVDMAQKSLFSDT